MKQLFSVLIMSLFVAGFVSCGSGENVNNKKDSVMVAVKTEDVSFMGADTTASKSFIAHDSNKAGKLPIVLVVPEWWGLNDYAKNRAKQLAALGYFAMAVDMYGDGKQGNDPAAAQALATPFYKDANKGNAILAAALQKAKSYTQADADKTVIIGYCFGGSMALNAARSGMDITGAVSFHGGLNTGVLPQKGMKAQVLVCHGKADSMVPEADVASFKKQMDSVGAVYTFKEYADATHAFSNPEATENGKKFRINIAYNEAADKASWQDMKDFFATIFK